MLSARAPERTGDELLAERLTVVPHGTLPGRPETGRTLPWLSCACSGSGKAGHWLPPDTREILLSLGFSSLGARGQKLITRPTSSGQVADGSSFQAPSFMGTQSAAVALDGKAGSFWSGSGVPSPGLGMRRRV